jgi:alpha-ribazole phosphatase
MRLLLARHGVTAWNVEGRFQGQHDVALSAAGKRQAALLAERLASEQIDEVLASDLLRATETARAVAAPRGLSMRFDARLREMNFGAWEGLTYEESRRGFTGTATAWEADAMRTAPPGGETLAELASRVGNIFADLKGKAGLDSTILVVAHGGSIQVLLCLAIGLPPRSRWQLRVDPASLSTLHLHPEGAVLTGLNDTYHLREVGHAS